MPPTHISTKRSSQHGVPTWPLSVLRADEEYVDGVAIGGAVGALCKATGACGAGARMAADWEERAPVRVDGVEADVAFGPVLLEGRTQALTAEAGLGEIRLELPHRLVVQGPLLFQLGFESSDRLVVQAPLVLKLGLELPHALTV